MNNKFCGGLLSNLQMRSSKSSQLMLTMKTAVESHQKWQNIMQVGSLATCKKGRKQGVNGFKSLGIVLLAQSCLSSFSHIRFYVSEGVIEA